MIIFSKPPLLIFPYLLTLLNLYILILYTIFWKNYEVSVRKLKNLQLPDLVLFLNIIFYITEVGYFTH
jgi:hypothetical protein